MRGCLSHALNALGDALLLVVHGKNHGEVYIFGFRHRWLLVKYA